jgi:decaprenylphospho-beta-D-ribofuranose 2-oxidase
MLKRTDLISFDGTERITAEVARPERYRDLLAVLGQSAAFIPRGAGLSYGAASMGQGVVSVDMKCFNRILAFDETTGVVVVEPGLSVGRLIEFLVRHDFCLPVVPGYPLVTVGGAVAFDVHGKSQFHSGNFGEWVEELELFHPDHGRSTCSRSLNPEIFELTIGGLGLTGMITRVTLRTERLVGNALEVTTEPVSSLESAAALMEAKASEVAALYSWHNFRHVGARFGSGLVFLERFVKAEQLPRSRARVASIGRRLSLPLWNGLTSRLALEVYERLNRRRAPRVLGLRQGFFPIEGLEGYYAAFGPRGFREYQLIVPRDRLASFERDCAELVRKERVPVTLASLKLFRGTGGQLRFRGSGICLAIDVPALPGAIALFRGLDRLAERYGACVNLSKDSRIGAEECERLFPDYHAYRDRLAAYDPKRRCNSLLRERIGV